MFDVGFSELLMVGLVALLVIGPERLPKAARIAGLWVGKARTTVATVKADIQQQLHAEEMREQLQQLMADESQRLERDRIAANHEIEQALTALAEPERHEDKSA